MNKLILASLIAALSGVTGTAQTAKAGHNNEAIAAIGGFIGGVIVGAAARDDYRAPAYCEPERGPRVVVEARYDGGYWDYVTVRTWIEGRSYVSFDNCGRRVRSWSPGHYEYRRERVWVDARHDRRHDRDRHYRD